VIFLEKKTLSGYSLRIKELREALNLKVAEFARSLNIPRSTLVGWEEGKSVSIEILKPLENIFNVNMDWLLTGEGEMLLHKQDKPVENMPDARQKRIPIYSEAELPEGAFVVPMLDQRLSAGGGSYVPEGDEVMALVRVPPHLARFGKNIAALPVEGDSMYPTLKRGDLVVCDSCGWSGEGIYALRMSGEGFVKRLTKGPGKIVILSDNPKYPPREEPEDSQDIQIIGRVHCAITNLV